MCGKTKYIEMFGSFTEPFNSIFMFEANLYSPVYSLRVHTDPEKSWNLKITLSSPGKSWNHALALESHGNANSRCDKFLMISLTVKNFGHMRYLVEFVKLCVTVFREGSIDRVKN